MLKNQISSKRGRFPSGAGLLLGLCLLNAFSGCKSRERREQKEERERLTMEMFQEMIRKGTLSPVGSMEDAFGDFHADMGAMPEDYSNVEGGEEFATLDGARVVLPEPEADPEPAAVTTLEPEAITVPLPPPNYYAKFGARIVVHKASGLITKPYPMRTSSSTELMDFIIRYGDFPSWTGEGEQPLDTYAI
ncbi:MAG: hypothetical protein ACI9F9_001941, partial [Candidatus Paceibacteria bacterium]